MALDQNALDSLRIDRQATPASSGHGSRRTIVIVVAALVVAALAVWAVFGLRSSAMEVRTVTATATSGSAPSAVLDGSGYVVARRQATVSAKVTGKIADVLIEEGMVVKEGQLLARLDDSSTRPQYLLAMRQLDSAKQNLNEVQVRVDQARKDLARATQLREQKLVSEQQLDTAQAEASANSAKLAALQSSVAVSEQMVKVRAQDLQDLEVRAPFNGVIVSKDAQPGEIISPMSAGGGFTRTGVATIVDMESREIEVDVNEAFINRVHAGQKTQAVLDAYPDWSIDSHVINIVPTADRQKATVRVRIGFDQLDPRILPDMGVKVHFLDDAAPVVASTAPAVRVPTSALVQADGKSFVWRIHDNAVERIAVRASGDRNGTTDIYAGVNAGDTIVDQPVSELRDGTKVKTAQK